MQQKHAALYCRLSVDDGSFGGSVSIETQKILLEQYCQSHEISNYEFYCDDGYSGTNFNRPAFKRMLVYGKRRNKTMKSKQVVKNPREEWIIAENTHEPIITQELWDTAHKVIA